MSRDDVRTNLESWEADSADYQARNACQLNRWDGVVWGTWAIPEDEIHALGDVWRPPHAGAGLRRRPVRHQPREARRERDRARFLGEPALGGARERRRGRRAVPAGARERRGAAVRRRELRPGGVRSRRDLVHRSARDDPRVRAGAAARGRARLQHRDALGRGLLARSTRTRPTGRCTVPTSSSAAPRSPTRAVRAWSGTWATATGSGSSATRGSSIEDLIELRPGRPPPRPLHDVHDPGLGPRLPGRPHLEAPQGLSASAPRIASRSVAVPAPNGHWRSPLEFYSPEGLRFRHPPHGRRWLPLGARPDEGRWTYEECRTRVLEGVRRGARPQRRLTFRRRATRGYFRGVEDPRPGAPRALSDPLAQDALIARC